MLKKLAFLIFLLLCSTDLSRAQTATATFISPLDTTTEGSWKGKYGADGYDIPKVGVSLPSYATFSLTNAGAHTWNASTTDPRALEMPAGAGAEATTWFNTTAFTMNVTISDGGTHQMALYALDWDMLGRNETIKLTDTQTGALLDTETVSSFANGAYLVWNISGNVTINVTANISNAVVSGIFFEPTPAGGGGTETVSVNPPGSNLAEGGTQQFTATVTNGTGQPTWTISGVSPTGAAQGMLSSTGFYTAPATVAVATAVTIKATAVDGQASGMATVNLSVPSADGTTATFVSPMDTTTEGSWNSKYGADGYEIPNVATNPPSYATFSLTNAAPYTWNSTTSDPRALELPSGAGAYASTWFNTTTFTMNVTINDGGTHQMALYALDWDMLGRNETIKLTDTQTGALLDTETVSSFANGAYLVWNISGNVTINVTANIPNAVVSGVFFEPISSSAPVPAPLPMSVAVSPTGATLTPGQTQTFSAAVHNSSNQSVTWSLSPNVGTISAAGLYTAPATITAAQSVTVTATTVATPTTSSSSSIALVPPSTSAQDSPTQDPAGIFNGNGGFSAANYVNMANNFGTPAMIPERYGNSWTGYHSTDPASGFPTWYQPPQYYFNMVGAYFYFTLPAGGAIGSNPGDYSSNYMQSAYVTNSSVSGSSPGVDGTFSLEMTWYTWTGIPQLSWISYGAGHPDAMLNAAFTPSYPGGATQPIGVTRAYGDSENAGESYMMFQNGQVAMGEGGNTAYFPYYFHPPYPTGFVPTAESVTNNGEFLLVTGWNTATHQGQLAVIAIGSYVSSSGIDQGFEWTENYPGFRNYSVPAFYKLMGVIDLPGMQAPTAVEAVGNWVLDALDSLPALPGNFPLSVEANWACLVPPSGACTQSNSGGNQLYDTAGFALVASRWERKVILVDLTPLFQEIYTGMFGSGFTTFRNNVANTGTGAGQWPPTFAENPSETPLVTATMNFTAPVTAISASLWPDNIAMIATDDNTLHVWSVDGLQTFSGTHGANPTQIATISVGNNITRIAHMKHYYWENSGSGPIPFGTNNPVRWQYICVSRGDKTFTWVDLSSGSPAVKRVLTDSRIVDPISAEDNNNHGTQSDLLDIADYGGNSVRAYRYGPVIYYTTGGASYGMGSGGTDPFEYEGAYATPTGPFDISIENIP